VSNDRAAPEVVDESPVVALGTVDIRALRARVIDEEGVPVLQLDDWNVSVDLAALDVDTVERAVLGARRLQDAAAEYARQLGEWAARSRR
jgi:hypothetical protein